MELPITSQQQQTFDKLMDHLKDSGLKPSILDASSHHITVKHLNDDGEWMIVMLINNDGELQAEILN